MKKIFSYIAPYPLHCFLIPLFFILHNYFYFFGLVSPAELYVNYLWWMLLPFLLFLLFKRMFKSASKGALFTSVLLLIYFFFPALLRGIKGVPLLEIIAKYSVSLPLLLIALFFLYRYLKKSKSGFEKTHRFLMILLLLFITIDLVLYIPKLNGDLNKENSFKTFNRPSLQPVRTVSTMPDIYFLIFDEHPSTASVKKITGYNNDVLDTQLTQLGFKISPHATSAFSQTQPALCSLLDMGEYPYNPDQPASFKELFAAGQLLANNQLFPFLEQQQYRIINASIFKFQNLSSVETPKEWWGQPGDMIKNQTLLNRVHEDIGWLKEKYFPAIFKNPVEKSIRADVDLTDTVRSILNRSIEDTSTQPKFVFAHFFLPHDPYKYDSTGKIFNGSYYEYLEALKTNAPFVQQLVYTRKIIVELAAHIIQKNKRPAVIIIQGDHGLRKYNMKQFGKNEMFKIFSAVYLPQGVPNPFPHDLYAPNTFRILLNMYFKQQLPLQKRKPF